jgi:branched-chain amino acid transport system substrate-binding protein
MIRHSLLTVLLATQVHAAQTVLILFPKLENLSLTGNLVTAGIDMSSTLFPQLKKDVNFVRVESDRNIKEMAEALEKSIRDHKPVAIIGSITSNSAFVVSEIAEKHKIPFITPFATHPDITKGKMYTFRACFDDDYQSAKIADFAIKRLRKKRVAVLYNEASSYSMGVRAKFLAIAKLHPHVSTLEVGFLKANLIDQEKINRVITFAPDLVLIPSYQVEAASVIAKLTAGLPKTTVYLGPDSWGGGRLFHKVFQEADPNFEGYYVQHISDASRDRASGDFKTALQKLNLFKSDSKQEMIAMVAPIAMGHDTGRILFEALAIAIQKKRPLVEALRLVSFEGMTGRINFQQGNTPQKPLYIYQINKSGEKFFAEYR